MIPREYLAPAAAGRARSLRLTAAWRRPLAAFLVHLALVLVVTGLAVAWSVQRPPIPAEDYLPARLEGVERYLVQPLANWDGIWYTWIAERGYDAHPATTAYWPLYPGLLFALHQVTGSNVALLGLIVSNLAFLGALCLLYRLVQLDYGEAVAGRTVWLLALFPTAFFFSAVYTESLFLLLTVAAVYCGRTERWGRAALVGVLAGLTRNTGVLLLVPLGLLLVQSRGGHPRRWWRQGLQLGAIALAPLLFLAYVGLIWGDPRLPLAAQSAPQWGRYQTLPWVTILDAFRQLDLSYLGTLIRQPSWDTLASASLRQAFMDSKSFDLASTLAFGALAVYTFRRVRLAYSLYALAAFGVPLLSPSHFSPLLGMPRYLIVLFPCFIALACLLHKRWAYALALGLSTVLFAALLTQFSTWFFVA